MIALGLQRYTRTRSNAGSSFTRDIAACSVRRMRDLPPPVGPTSIIPWRTTVISYSWMHLTKNSGAGCSPDSFVTSNSSFSNAAYSTFGSATPGKRSLMIEPKSTTSS